MRGGCFALPVGWERQHERDLDAAALEFDPFDQLCQRGHGLWAGVQAVTPHVGGLEFGWQSAADISRLRLRQAAGAGRGVAGVVVGPARSERTRCLGRQRRTGWLLRSAPFPL